MNTVRRLNKKRRKNINPRKTRAVVLWFTGLPGSGKSTVADRVAGSLRRKGVKIERLDGDQVRRLFPDTGFTRKEREEHLKRVGYLASVLEKHGITVVASFVSPYRRSRDVVRSLCRNFVEVYVSTPLAECERRDPKGLYKKARAGQIKNFTGISDPYETPKNPAIEIDTSQMTLEKASGRVMKYLCEKGFLLCRSV